MANLTAQPNPDDFIYALAAQGDTVFAACASGLYRSDDGGETWVLATESLGLSEAVPSTALALAPEAAHEESVFAGMAGGMLRSADGGRTWVLGTAPAPPPTITALVISPDYAEDGVLLAGTMEDGILRSADRGWRWTPWNFGLLDLSIYSLGISPDFREDETLFAGAETGVFRSTNGGRAWREVDLPVGFETVLSLAVSPSSSKTAPCMRGPSSKGLLRSSDGGANWQPVGDGLFDGPVNAVLLAAGQSGGLDAAVLCNSAAWLSRDGGVSWSPILAELSEQGEITALLAPRGFTPGSPIWAGMVGGRVVKVNL